jgi:hypothetical protein
MQGRGRGNVAAERLCGALFVGLTTLKGYFYINLGGTLMSDHDKNLFIEQHKDGYAILRGGVKEPVAIEPTQDAAIEKARKLEADAAIHVERVCNVEGGVRDKWRRI